MRRWVPFPLPVCQPSWPDPEAIVFRHRLDFAHPQPAVKLNGSRLGALALAASLVVCAGLGLHYQALTQEIEAAEASIEQLLKSSSRLRQPRASSRQTLINEVRQVNQAALQLTIPWDELFRELESATDRRVALLALQPNFQKREIRISGEADDFGALRRYLDRLERGEELEGVRLISHEIVARGTATSVRFEITAGWRVRT